MPRPADEALATALEHVLVDALGAAQRVEGLHRLSGGASRETFAFDAISSDGVARPLILQRERPGGAINTGGGTSTEAGLLRAAAAQGVPVPAVVASGPAEDARAGEGPGEPLGAAYLVVERLEGETIPRRILRDEQYAGARARLAAQCGRALAGIHAIPVEDAPGLHDLDQITQFRSLLDALGEPHPAFELAFRWLEANRPPVGTTRVVHGDFRNGNLIVGPEGLRAVLDWELAHLGDPMEDLGWLCVKAWRFGGAPPVGGFGEYDDLFTAYAEAAGLPDGVDAEVVRWWEILSTVKWGVMCIIQAASHTRRVSRSVELAAIGRRTCENEHDVLALLPMTAPHDSPTAAELVEAVREFLENDVLGATEGRVQFHTRVAINVLGQVQREIEAGAAMETAHEERLTALGFGDDVELASAIRSGALDDRYDEVKAAVWATVRDKLAVANPRYLEA